YNRRGADLHRAIGQGGAARGGRCRALRCAGTMTADAPKRGRGRPRKSPEMVPMTPVRGEGLHAERGCRSLSPENSGGKMTPETVIAYLETLLVPEGPKAGQPLQLAEYQRQFIR